MENSEKAIRYNSGKPRWSLVHFESLEPMVRVLEYGENKYSDFQWMKGLSHRQVAESLFRHLTAYLDGEDKDNESGEHHVGHILSNAMFLSYNIKHHPELDDRHKN